MELSDEYRRCWEIASQFPLDKEVAYPEMAEIHEFDLVRGKQVLEYGCGNGSDTLSFLKRGAKVWFADIVPLNVETTSRRVREAGFEVHPLLLEESDDIRVEDGSFDIIYANGVLHHIENVTPVVAELARVIRLEGTLFAMLYTEFLWKRCLLQIEARIVAGVSKTPEQAFCTITDYGAPYARAYTEEEGKQLFEGFVVRATALWNGSDFRTFKAVRL